MPGILPSLTLVRASRGLMSKSARQHVQITVLGASGARHNPPRPLASGRVDSLAFELIEQINQNQPPPAPSRGPGRYLVRLLSRSLALKCQMSEVFGSGSCTCSRWVSADPTLQSPILRGVLLWLGSCLALGRCLFSASPARKWPLSEVFCSGSDGCLRRVSAPDCETHTGFNMTSV